MKKDIRKILTEMSIGRISIFDAADSLEELLSIKSVELQKKTVIVDSEEYLNLNKIEEAVLKNEVIVTTSFKPFFSLPLCKTTYKTTSETIKNLVNNLNNKNAEVIELESEIGRLKKDIIHKNEVIHRLRNNWVFKTLDFFKKKTGTPAPEQ